MKYHPTDQDITELNTLTERYDSDHVLMTMVQDYTFYKNLQGTDILDISNIPEASINTLILMTRLALKFDNIKTLDMRGEFTSGGIANMLNVLDITCTKAMTIMYTKETITNKGTADEVSAYEDVTIKKEASIKKETSNVCSDKPKSGDVVSNQQDLGPKFEYNLEAHGPNYLSTFLFFGTLAIVGVSMMEGVPMMGEIPSSSGILAKGFLDENCCTWN